jgi:hypothetical protein
MDKFMLEFMLPYALWGLLGILLFFFCPWRFPEKRLFVGSLELWRSVLPSLQSPSSRKRPVVLFSLLLSIIAYLCINVALAKPLWKSRGQGVSIILDCSASMQTKTQNATVFLRAVSKLKKILDSLQEQDRVTLILYPSRDIYTQSPSHIASLLKTIKPSIKGGDFTSFLKAFASTQEPPVYCITDGAGYKQVPGITPIFCGIPATDNVGIVSWKSQEIARGQYRIFSVIRNFSAIQKTIELRLTADMKNLYAKTISLAPRQRYSWSEIFDLKDSKTLSLSLAPSDNFVLDNSLHAMKTPPLKLWLPEQSPLSIQTIAKILPGIEVVKNQQEADFYTAFSHLPPQGEAWFIYARTSEIPRTENSYRPISEIVYSADPLLSAVYPELLPISDALPLSKPFLPHTKILLDTPSGPIMAYQEEWLYIGFSPTQSGWEKSPSFPIFWQNAFRFFGPERNNFVIATSSGSINFLNEQESDNRGIGETPLALPLASNIPAISAYPLTTYFVLTAILLLIIVWYYEDKLYSVRAVVGKGKSSGL